MSVDRRSLIVDAASKSFSLFGYKGTTMEQVAKIANVGKGTIYTFFSNKEQLFQEVMNKLLLEMKLVAEKVISEERSFFDNLTEALNELLEFRKDHELALKLTQEVREIGTPMANEALSQMEQVIIEHIAAKIERAIKRQEIKACDTQMTAFVMLRLYTALAVEWSTNHEKLQKQEIAQRLRFYLEKGLAIS
ncbi:MAG TPA: TetR/AcrR family transcriptional regulator [Candidatus Paenibacillus intestinavium]|nr:TetR/AcrR family transcriptional regulator [Candidatus Paenibacillus intestinavium]